MWGYKGVNMARLFTSDLHFFHGRITELTERCKFTDKQHHTEWVLDIINRQVGPRDTLVSLGDFSFANADKTGTLFDRMRCKDILLISGNHDRFQPECQRVWYKEISIGGFKTALSHFAFESWHKQHKGAFHLHGHSHGNLAPRGRRLDVGLDNAYKILGEHRLFTENEVFDILSKVEVVVADSHRSCDGAEDDNT